MTAPPRPPARRAWSWTISTGNTVTAEWNYAQRSAMSDNFHGTEFGQSTRRPWAPVSGDPVRR
ncbi:MAG: hypothetical protein ACR2MP_28780 [Streptosporangiaceae bacterium]